MKSVLWVKLLAAAVSMFLFQSCYLLKQGSYLFRYNRQAVDNRLLLDAPETPESTREFLRLVEDISAFAEKELGLEKNDNYSRFVETNQDFLAWVVSGTKENSFAPYLWGFPLVGKVPYKGFYEKEDAIKEAERLKSRHCDVWIRKVDAFSTLGYLKDPLYSYMKDYSIYAVANLIIHEQTHATIFLKGQGEFNEGLATFVGDMGAKMYVSRRFGPESEEYLSILDREKDRLKFHSDLNGLRDRLEKYYSEEHEDMKSGKEKIISGFQYEFRKNYDDHYRTASFKKIGELPINNAFISLYSLYNDNLDIFRIFHEKHGSDLRITLKLIRETVTGSKDAYGEIKNEI